MIALGLDIGTTTIAAVAYDVDAHRLLARVTVPHDAGCTPADKLGSGWAEIDLARSFAIALSAMRQIVGSLGEQSARVRRIGVTGQMHGVAFLDANLRPVRPAITWQDQRTAASVADFIARCGGEGAFANMGCLPAAGYLGPTLAWLRQHDRLPRAVACFIPDAVASMLTAVRRAEARRAAHCRGESPVTDATLAASSGIYDIVSHEWDRHMLSALGLSDVLLPTVGAAGAGLGLLDGAIAGRLGLTAGVVVGVPLGDHQASLIGSAADRVGCVHINIGTSSQISAVVDRFAPVDTVHGIETRPFPGRRYVRSGAGLCGGEAFALLRRFFEATATLLGCEPPPSQEAYAAMVRAASAVPFSADGLRADVRFDGARYRPAVAAALTFLRRANFTPAHVARAVLEGIVDELWQFFEAMQAEGIRASRLIGSGNALRSNPLLVEILSSRFGLPMQLAQWEEEAAVGAAIVAARGAAEGQGGAGVERSC